MQYGRYGRIMTQSLAARRYVALFRGINVGGHNKIAMAALSETFEQLGHTDVSTIIQSGNVCFTSERAPDETAAELRPAVAADFDVDVPILVRPADAFRAILAAHPFEFGELEPKMHHIMFLADSAPADARDLLGDHEPDSIYAVIDDAIHVRYPNGSARAKLTVDLVDRRLATIATARNLPTCEKIAAAL